MKRGTIYATVFIPLLVEFTSQFFLTFWGVMVDGPYNPPAANLNSSLAADVSTTDGYLQQVVIPSLQTGLSVWMQIVLFWKISVAHFNPAVSMAFLVSGHLRPIMFIPYVAMQCLASILAALVGKAILGANPAVAIIPDDVNGFAFYFNDFIMTGIFVFFAVCMVMDESYDHATGPIAIGLAVFQGALSSQWVGIVCISPSRVFGPAVVTGGAAWNRHWLIWLADLSGAAFASALFMFFFAPTEICWFFRLKRRIQGKSSHHDSKPQGVLVEEKKKSDVTNF